MNLSSAISRREIGEIALTHMASLGSMEGTLPIDLTVQNDSGKSDIFHIGESVKQGTVWAAPICANFIDKGFREIEMGNTHLVSVTET